MGSCIHLLDLIKKEKLDSILKGFTEVAGVASIIADADGRPITDPHNFTDFCLQYCRSTPEGKRRCHLSDRYGGFESLRTGNPPVYNCLNSGLMDCAAPIIVEGCHLATVLCGQVLEEPLGIDFSQERAIQIGVADIDGYLESVGTVPLMSRKQLLDIANLMAVITQTISELALQKYLQQKHSQRYLHKLINSVSDCIIATNMDGIISIINQAGIEMFGREGEELTGRSIMTLFSGDDFQVAFKRQTEEKPKAECRIELNAIKADRQSVPVQVSIAGINMGNSQNSDYVAVIRDISQQRKIERMKEDLIGMVAHDIKNPVLSMQKALELLGNKAIGPLSEMQTELVQLALDTNHQLFGMVSNLLDIYRKENGQFLLDKALFDMNRVVEKSVSQVQFLARDRMVAVSAASSRSPLMINADRDRMQRTCTNLIENALRYSPEGGEVEVFSQMISKTEGTRLAEAYKGSGLPPEKQAESYLLVSIQDQGPGIPPEYHEAVFEKFFTISTAGDQGRKCLGLGLTFCKQVIEVHGGAIWVKSPLFLREGGERRGCRFQFTLPAPPTQ